MDGKPLGNLRVTPFHLLKGAKEQVLCPIEGESLKEAYRGGESSLHGRQRIGGGKRVSSEWIQVLGYMWK